MDFMGNGCDRSMDTNRKFIAPRFLLLGMPCRKPKHHFLFKQPSQGGTGGGHKLHRGQKFGLERIRFVPKPFC